MAAGSDSPRASARVHAALRDEILGGALEPGAAVDSERALAERFDVHRQSVREALKRLEQAGLVRISHGGATRVLDWRDSGGLELLADLGTIGAPAPAELERSVIEMRASVGVDAARLCAERAGDDARAEIERLAGAAAAAVGGPVAELEQRYAALWRAVVIGSGNLAYRLAFNSLLRTLPSRPRMAAAVRPNEGEAIGALGAAIRARDAGAAMRCARALLAADRDR